MYLSLKLQSFPLFSSTQKAKEDRVSPEPSPPPPLTRPGECLLQLVHPLLDHAGVTALEGHPPLPPLVLAASPHHPQRERCWVQGHHLQVLELPATRLAAAAMATLSQTHCYHLRELDRLVLSLCNEQKADGSRFRGVNDSLISQK